MISTRSRRETSAALTRLKQNNFIRVVYSAQRLHRPAFNFAPKTYLYTVAKTPRGHILHWLYIAHLRALFTVAARQLNLKLEWRQSNKHNRLIPDATISFTENITKTEQANRSEGDIQTEENVGQHHKWFLEVDNSTEGYRPDLMRRFQPNTLFVAFWGKERLKICERPEWQGLATAHTYFHDKESSEDFNILTSPAWWDGKGWRALIEM